MVLHNNFLDNKKYSLILVSLGTIKDTINYSNNYWNTLKKNKIEETISDFFDTFRNPIAIYEPFLTQPSDSAHGIVWKVVVDGKYPEAGNIDAFGEGQHIFEVYFNRKMDMTVEPMLSFGVREPFTQNVVKKDGHWSADGKIWTAKYYFNKYTGDGINYIRVADAQDDEYFEIPIEDSRFSFVIDAAGSASTIFVAKDGKGRGVELKWENEADRKAIGYNIYRFENETDTTYTDTVLVNSKVVTDLEFVDSKVEGYKRYYYMYTSISEDFKESGFSKVASVVPSDVNSVEENAIKTFTILSIYPNPVQETAHIEAEIYQPGMYKLEVVDIYGNKVLSTNKYMNFGRNTIDIRIAGQSSGMYFVRLGNTDYTKMMKFMYIR
jgi:hypothetical protein